MSITSSQGDDLERGAQRTGSAAVAGAAERTPDQFGISAVMDRDRERDRGVARVRVGARVGLVMVDEKLPDPTIIEPAHRGGVVQPRNREVERNRCAAIWQSFAPGHDTPPLSMSSWSP